MNKSLYVDISEELYEKIRKQSFDEKINKKEIVIRALESYFIKDKAIPALIIYENKPPITPQSVEKPAIEYRRCEAPPHCKNPDGLLCKVTYVTDEGEETKELYLCGYHRKQSAKNGVSVERL